MTDFQKYKLDKFDKEMDSKKMTTEAFSIVIILKSPKF